jgi:hypothetical protein
MEGIATVILSLLFLAYLVCSVIRHFAWSTNDRPEEIEKLADRYWRAREIGDIAGADQIGAQLRDTRGSGWSARQ